MTLHFSKMHGIGNDFVVIDCRVRPFALSVAAIRRMADRHRGIGFDQLLTIEPARRTDCTWRYAIYNQDGSPAGQCGNGVRCVALWLNRHGGLTQRVARLQSPSGVVAVELLEGNRVRVDMGVPDFSPARIPLRVAAEADSYTLEIDAQPIRFGAVSMGNPHMLTVVKDIVRVPVTVLGPALEMHSFFPQRCNVGFAQIVNRERINLRVWERGVGETLACGSGACAAVAVLQRQELVDHSVRVSLPGGDLEVDWAGHDHSMYMAGGAQFAFEGEWQE